MFKRVRWFGVGVVAGAGTTMYGYVRWRESRGRLTPDKVSESVVGAARVVGRRARTGSQAAVGAMREAVAEGREAMVEAEERIIADLERPTRPDP
jgi:hypothetical protein